MCTSKEQIKRYENLLEGIMIDTNDDGVTFALLANNSMVVIDETQNPPRAIVCNNHEFQSGCCEAMQAVNYYYEQIASIFAKEDSEEKAPVARNVIPEQNNRVEYQVLGSCKKHYHTVQMVNGRASCCFDHVGAICQHRVYHPAVPCRHMQAANLAEEDVRAQARIDQTMLQEPFASMPDDMQQVAREELTKCNEAYQAVMRQTISVEVGHPDYWQLSKKREKKAKKSYRDQYYKSLEILKQLGQHEAIAA